MLPDPIRGPIARRTLLQCGAAGLGGLAWPGFLPATPPGTLGYQPLAEGALTGKSVIFLHMHGGPSQYETFDPKTDAPEGIRTLGGVASSALPGVAFGAALPKLAARADRLAVVRSFMPQPNGADHGIRPLVSEETYGGNLGSAFASVAGSNDARTGMPANLILYPRAVDPAASPGLFGAERLATPGAFGAAASPFVPGGGTTSQANMTLQMPVERLENRRALLTAFDGALRTLDDTRFEHENAVRQQAYRLLLRGVGDAFDLSREDVATLARYDTAPLLRAGQIDRTLLHYRDYIVHAQTFGKLLLLARRLCERGAGFVTVTTNFVWDMHGPDVGSKNLGIEDGMRHVMGPFDHAVAALLDDLAERGLTDKVLLVCCGEMGRTARINSGGGRDHWGKLGALMLAGGGLRTGQVIGQSVRNGTEPNSEPVFARNLVATVMRTLLDLPRLRLLRGMSREVLQMCSHDPIAGLHST